MEGNLLVLGNGFDLHCGLKSRFSDYYENNCLRINKELFSLFEKKEYEAAKSLCKAYREILNFWSFLFYINYYSKSPFAINGNKNKNWFDIEELIKDALTKEFRNKLTIADFVKNASDSRIQNKTLPGSFSNPYFFFAFCQESYINNAYDYLLSELHIFESDFRDYIFSIADFDYKQNCKTFLKKLITQGERVHLLNFNYTTVNESRGQNLIYMQTNLHGSVDDEEIIIGIDSGSIRSRDLIKFTKTYRNVHRLKQQFALPSPFEVGGITFYGHSLADADFSYFHSLFDTYKLYDGHLKLNFYFSNFFESEKANENNHAEYVKRVYDLINKYSKKTHNDQNLLHRLILEGRILIKEVD